MNTARMNLGLSIRVLLTKGRRRCEKRQGVRDVFCLPSFGLQGRHEYCYSCRMSFAINSGSLAIAWFGMATTRSYNSFIRQVVLLCCSMLLHMAPVTAQTAQPYLIGRGITDITGPAVGMPMWGFGRPDQIDEGIHIRQRSRAFVIAQADDPDQRLVFVSADLGSIDHHIALEVVERLQQRFGNRYTWTMSLSALPTPIQGLAATGNRAPTPASTAASTPNTLKPSQPALPPRLCRPTTTCSRALFLSTVAAWPTRVPIVRPWRTWKTRRRNAPAIAKTPTPKCSC